LEWLDIFHRLVEAGYYLVATEITPDTNPIPILVGLLLLNAPGDLYIVLHLSTDFDPGRATSIRWCWAACRWFHPVGS